ncbi:hypothetical protein U8P73_35965 (plasmid) [Rhizobium beringeri]|uniref:hypothetical protein n=1 Tax=Rhizobium beringeri TaxID=3019934 RepID=UPI002DDCE7EC|nr:hypothetical protein [Rhizobium beringeri]WSG93548.1 hypothetical protein U8P73_35965 [Rhizobium beringeri]
MAAKPYAAHVGTVSQKVNGRLQTIWSAGKIYTEDDIARMLNKAFDAGYFACRADVAARLNFNTKAKK